MFLNRSQTGKSLGMVTLESGLSWPVAPKGTGLNSASISAAVMAPENKCMTEHYDSLC